MPTVVPADSRPLSWPPIGALPRNRLASSATGGASPISPTPRLHRTPCPAPVGRGALTPPHDTHRTASQKLSLRGAQRRGNPSSPSRPPRNSPCVGAGFYPARLYRIPIPRVGGGDCPPSCQPIPAHCRGRQSGHFLETGSLLPPPAALRRFPRRPVCTAPHVPHP